MVFDVPANARGVDGGQRYGDEEDDRITECLFEVRCIVVPWESEGTEEICTWERLMLRFCIAPSVKLVWSELHTFDTVWSEMGGSIDGLQGFPQARRTTAPSKLLCGFMMINFLME